MVYVINVDYKQNIILDRDFNTWCIITKNKNFFIEFLRDMI